MSRYNLTSTYTAITETKGTLQNMSPHVSIVISTDATEDGIVVYPLNSIGFTQQIYAKTTGGNVEVAVVPFVQSAEADTAEALKTARIINVEDADGTNTGTGASFDGTEDVTIGLPATIKATLTGNADTATALETARTFAVQDNDGTNTGTGVNFDGTADVTMALPATIKAALTGNASTATALQTARTVQTNLASTASASFDGSANITPGVTGVLPVANGGSGASTVAAARVNFGIGYRRRTRQAFTLEDMIAAVESGNYYEYDIEPGDYYEGASGYTYIFAGDNPLKGTASPSITNNHAGLIVDTHVLTAWNSSASTAGGYVASDLHAFLTGSVLTNVISDIGSSHLYAHNKIYTTAMTETSYNRLGTNTGAASACAASTDQYIAALTEMQVYGGTIFSSSGFDTGEGCQQLEVFQRFKFTDIFGNETPWLRDIVSKTHAARAYFHGNANNNNVAATAYAVGLIAFY